MIPGFNSNIIHGDVEYHVQTEDLGRRNPCVLTLVYHEGVILAREKVNYRDVLGEDPPADQIKRFMEEQHHRIIARVKAGQLQGPAVAQPAKPPVPPPTPPAPPARPAAAPRTSPAPAPTPPPPDKGLDQLIDDYVHRRAASKPH